MKLPEDYNAFGCAQIACRLDDGYLAPRTRGATV